MFSLLYGLYELAVSRAEVRLLIVGLERAGKTTLLEQVKAAYSQGGSATGGAAGGAAALPPAYRPMPLTSIVPTIGMNLGKAVIQGVDAVFWDVGGSMRGIWDQYYSGADCVLFVVDASERARFGEAASTLELVLQRIEACGARMPIVVMANKSDRRDAARASEVLDFICKPAGLLLSAASGAGSSGLATAASSGGGSGDGFLPPPLAAALAFVTGGGGATAAPPDPGVGARRECRIFEVSALTLEGLRDAVDWAVAAAKVYAEKDVERRRA